MWSLVPSGPLPTPEDKNDSDRVLLDRLRAYVEQRSRRDHSDPAADDDWDRVFQLYSVLFLNLVRERHWPEGDCEDGVQDLWMTVLTQLTGSQFDPHRGHLMDWIMAIARHRVSDLERCRRRRSMKHLDLGRAGNLPGREPEPELDIDRKCMQELVRDAVAELGSELNAQDFEAFRLHWFDGLTIREIALRLGKSEAHLWSSHHRAIQRLRALLARRLESDTTS